MTMPFVDPVMEAKQRAAAALLRWREARLGVNDPDGVPARLDDIVEVAQQTIGVIGQDVVTEVEAIAVELAALRFRVDPDEALGRLEAATYALDGALGRLSRAASRAGFAQSDDDIGLPPGVRVPLAAVEAQLKDFVAAVEGVRPVLAQIKQAQASSTTTDARQQSLIRNLVEKVEVKLEIVGVKIGNLGNIDISGLAGLATQLKRLLASFVSTVSDAASSLSDWLSRDVPGWIRPVLAPLALGATGLAKATAGWIERKKPPANDPPAAPSPTFDWNQLENMIARGDFPPDDVIPDVTSLDMSYRHITAAALNAIKRLVGLEKLSLRYADDLRPLANLTALQVLDLRGTRVSDLSSVSGLKALRSLDLRNTPVSDLSALSSLTALQSLNLMGTPVSDLSPLAGLTALQLLNLMSTRVSDLSPLARLTALQSLSLRGTQVSDISALSRLTALQSLDLMRTLVSDLSPLSGLTGLQSLTLMGTQVSDLSPLARLTALQSLTLGDTQVLDLSVLRGLPNLRSIAIEEENPAITTLGLPTKRASYGYLIVRDGAADDQV